jgi:hypothetical protein
MSIVATVQRGLNLVGFLAIFASTARGSFQSKPTVEAVRCKSIARAKAGWLFFTLSNRPGFASESRRATGHARPFPQP